MKIFSIKFLLFLFVTTFYLPVNAQPDGEQLFKTNCAVCHKIGAKLVGPDLMGVNDRHSEEWLLKFIKSSQTVIKSGDEAAVKLFNENFKLVMPDQPTLSNEDIKAVLSYIAAFSVEQDQAATEIQKEDKLAGMSENFLQEEIKEGTRLFLGLKSPEKGGESCVNCHYTTIPDSLNWNPSAADLSKYSLSKTDAELLKSINNPSSGKLKEVHQNYNLSEDEFTSIKAYLIDFGKKGLKEVRPLPKRLLTFLIFGFLIVLMLIDLIWTHKIKYKVIHLAVILLAIVFISKIIIEEAYAVAYATGYEPDQPIKFSHKVHAGQNRIDCQYCHSSAETSKTAGIPSANVCLNCHKAVKTGPNSGSFEIAKIYDAIENKKPIEWVKVHNLPDHVFFSHAQHVNAGKISCDQCHGQVEEMHVVKQVSELSMGWCLECHKNTKINFTNNAYYSQMFEQLHKDLKSGKIDSVTESQVGGIDCQKCHY
ncbi:MAG: c-type cytochrome [Chlorobi bacterium]|nr:c-type cytochrome [Chlorobiota bacterium]